MICLPYAGGNVFSYKNFFPFLHDSIEYITLELPGRGRRIREALLEDVDEMLIDLERQIEPHIKEEYFLYGHSMGGFLGNALIHELKKKKKRQPLFFLATGSAATQGREDRIILHQLDDVALMKKLNEFGGFPDEILQNEELSTFLLPIIRSDIKALEIWDVPRNQKHDTPIHLIMGTDEDIQEEDIYNWKLETNATLEVEKYKGGHFFILDHFEKIGNLIEEKLSLCLGYTNLINASFFCIFFIPEILF